MDAPALMRALTHERTRFVRFVRPRVETAADAEDVVQRALLRAMTRAESIDDPARVRAWFYRILRRAVADHHRGRSSDPVRAVDAGIEAIDEAGGAPALEPPRATCACAVRLLAGLRPAYAEVLRRIDLEGGDPAVVARALGISTGNLHVRLHRARQVLRDDVKHHCGVDTLEPCIDCTCDAQRCCSGPRTAAPKTGHQGRSKSEVNMAISAASDVGATIRAFHEAFYRGDTNAARQYLREDLSFVGPAAHFHTADDFLKTAAHVAPGVKAIEVHKVFVDGADVCVFYDLVLDHRVSRLPVAAWHRLEDGKIASIRMILDTGPFARGAAAAGDAEVDPVCKMTVQRSTAAATRTHAGGTYYFCNAGCAVAFEQDPGRYLGPRRS